MPGETALTTLLRSLKPTLQPTSYVFLTIPKEEMAHPFPIPFDSIRMTFWESEGCTMIVPLVLADQFAVDYFYRCKMVTLAVHSSLEAIGFMAAVATRLAQEGLSSNPVSAYYHDHLFVKEEEAERVVSLLEDMAREANNASAS